MSKIENRFLELLAIKRRRDKKSWTYEEISGETGISTGTLVRYAQQRHGMFDQNTLLKLCAFFKCDLGDLLIIVDPSAVAVALPA
jgi:DNA-binding Xre family transcriptional regulator